MYALFQVLRSVLESQTWLGQGIKLKNLEPVLTQIYEEYSC